MAEIVISIAAKVAEYLVDPILQPIRYAFKYQRNMEELKKQVKMLTNQRDSVQHSVDEAKRQGDEIEKQVQEWLDSVDEFVKKVVKPIIDDQVKVLKLIHERESVQHSVDEANKQGDEIEKQVQEWLNSAVVKPITDDSAKANKLCSTGFCPNPMTRYSLSKKAAKAVKDGVVLLGQGQFPKVPYRLPLQRTNSLIIKGYEDFTSRMSLSERIMEALADTDTDLIGVYGMGGVGKTTLVNKVAQQAKENKLFDVVVTAVVTETPDIIKIQDQIADELGLKFQEPSVRGRAARLRERIKKENRIIVILDNVWAKLDLESIGIPVGGDEKGSITQKVHQKEGENANRKQCKILFTSRNLDVLCNGMDIQKNFKVEVLCDAEGESLFWKTVGYSQEKSDLNPIAVEIVGKCGGLPLAIKTIANALKNKSLPSWKTARDQLKKANPKNIKGMNEDVYSTIELSFNFLEGEEAKSLFLLCSLCNAGYGVHITDMLKYSMGLGLFQDVYTLEEGRNKLHSLIDDLKTSCLLMDDDDDRNRVKMHDVIHVVAISISATTKLWFNLQNNAGLKEMLEKKLPKDSVAFSIHLRADIYELPEKMEFPKLELFWLYEKDASLQIQDAVFEGMKGLKVLDMTGIHLLPLPSSLRCLINLCTLCLDCSRLEDVAIIGELKELEILSFLKSDIEHLPREIGQLTRLRLLDLSLCSKLKVIEPNVISSLTCLEELYMGNSFDQWDNEGQSNACLAELKQLSCLTALDIHVPNSQIIPQDLSFGKLERYRIFIGEVWDWYGKYETSRTLKLKLSSSIYLSNEIKSLLNKTEDVHLDKLKGVKSVVYELSGEGFPQLKHLHVQNGSDIQYIANSFGWGLCNVFPRLESLFLDNLINLEKICHAQLAPESFSKLRIMKVRKCDRLKHLFSFSMVNNLSQLQEIEVTNCKKLKEIISKESMELVHQNESIRRIEFTQLHTLTLKCLPQLTSFSFNASTPDIGSQEIVAEDEADGFMFFSQNVVLPSLNNLKLSSINIRCTWLDQLPVISSCQALSNLTLEECNDLKFLFSNSIVQSLVQLQKLEIRNCKSIEGIINTDELSGKEKVIMMVFPKLLNLQLEGLPKLSRFSSGNSVEFFSLTQISIEDCPNLKTFFSSSNYADIKQSKEIEELNCQDDIYPLFDEKVMLPTLASINLSSIPIRTIWHDQLQPMSSCFQNLKEIIMDGCDTLKYVFSSSMVEGLIQLEVLEISNCKAVEVVTIIAGERISNTWFPKLYRLVLEHLPELTTFCNVAGKSIELTSLAELFLRNCPKMLAFVSNSQLTDMPAAKEEQKNSKKNLQYSHIQPFFDEKVELPTLASLILSSIASQTIWHNQLQALSACFHNLTEFTVFGCDDLKYLFPFSVAESLDHLEFLDIRNCKLLEGVIITQGERKSSTLFRKLKKLTLDDLPELTRLCNFNGNSIELPSLSELMIWNCPKMQTFASDSLPGIKETEEANTEAEDNLPSFFDEKVRLPTLTSLKLFSIASQTISWHNQLQPHSACFHNLTKLTVDGCDNLKYLFPFSVAESLDNLEVLDMRNCKLMEGVIITQEERKSSTPFRKLKQLDLNDLPELTRFCNFNGNSIELPSLSELMIWNCPKMQTFASDSLLGIEETEEVNTETEENLPSFFDEKVTFSCLKELKLIELPELLHLWKKNSQPSKVFENLAYLEVSYCCNLKTLIPSSVSLQNLETLRVRNCDGLISLVTFSTSKSLEKLKRMEIIDCKLVEEIIIDRRDDIKDVIVFNQLEYLKLQDLPSLTSFCKGSFTIEFPYLQRVLVIGCLKMMNFSQGVLSTPKLQSLQMTESSDEGCWEGDLNTTIQKLFRDEVGLRYIENFTVSNFPHLKEVWHEKILVSYFSNLKSLVVDDKCCCLRYIFTPSVALGLVQLQDLKIKNCVILEVITIIRGEETASNTMFPNLNSLDLINLPNLTCFCNFAENSIELPSLTQLSIKNCPNMETFISNFLGVNMSTRKDSCHTDIQPLFDEKVGLSNLKFLRLDKMDKLRKIWHHQLSSDSFCKLYSFGVYNCHNVLNVIPSNMLGRLQKLDELWLINCSSLCEIFELQASSCGKTQAITATQLKTLKLNDLPKLKHIWDVDSQGLLTCQNLISIEVEGCDSLKSIFPASVGRNLLRLEELCIDNCCMVEEIFAKEEQVDEAMPRFPQLTFLRLAELPRLRSFYPRVHVSE